MLKPLGLVLGGALLSFLLVEGLRRYALRRGVLDLPNQRSSHTRPTPRGGGIGVVVPVVAAMTLFGLLPSTAATMLGVAAVLVTAAVGSVDDHKGLSVGARLPIHVAAGALVSAAVVLSGNWTSFGLVLNAAWWIFWTVSAINVVNFLDGSDGMIGLQGLVYSVFAAAVLSPGSRGEAAALVSGGAFLGFLALNRPPAKIFLGDAGSGAVGVIFVLLGLSVMNAREWSVVAAYLPLAPLFVDELLTMLRRVREGADLRVAHRTHYYQRFIQSGMSHSSVAGLYAALAVPGAAIPSLVGGDGWLLSVTAAAYVLFVALLFRVGDARVSGGG